MSTENMRQYFEPDGSPRRLDQLTAPEPVKEGAPFTREPQPNDELYRNAKAMYGDDSPTHPTAEEIAKEAARSIPPDHVAHWREQCEAIILTAARRIAAQMVRETEAVEALEAADHLLDTVDTMRYVHDGKHDYLWGNLSNAANQYRAKTPKAYSGAALSRLRAILDT